MEAVKKGDWVVASRYVEGALKMDSRHPSVLRAAARFCSGLGRVEGINYWQMLAAMEPLGREDRLEYVRLALLTRRLDLAREQLAALLATSKPDLDAVTLVLELMELVGGNAGVEMGQLSLELFPGNDWVEWRVGRFLARQESPLRREEGERVLWTLALGGGSSKARAIATLVEYGQLRRSQLDVLRRSLGVTLGGTNQLEEQLLDLELQWRSDNSRRRELTSTAVGLTRETSTGRETAVVVTWLLRMGEPGPALALLPLARTKTRGDWMILHLQALADLGRWSEIEQAMAGTEVVLAPHIVGCFRGIAELRRGKRESALASFNRALAACQGDVERFKSVSRYAERVGLPEIAMEAWRQVMSNPALVRQGAREIRRLANNFADLPTQLSAARRLLELDPDDLSVQRDFAYLNLILDTRDPQAIELADRLYNQRPGDFEFRLVASLACLRRQEAAKALEILEGSTVDWGHAPARAQAIFVSALGASNQRSAARELARKVDVTQLKPPERELVVAWLPASATGK